MSSIPHTALAIMLVTGGVAACNHTPAFTTPPGHVGMHPDFPIQMTFSNGTDLLGGFTAAGDELFYTYCEDTKAGRTPPCGIPPGAPSTPDTASDRCVAALPTIGGSRSGEWCGSSQFDADSIKRYFGGTRLADGSVVAVYGSRRWNNPMFQDAALYRFRPGAFAPERLLGYEGTLGNVRVPRLVLARGPSSVITVGISGNRQVDIAADGTITTRDVPSFDALDAATGEAILIDGGMVHTLDLASVTTSPFIPLPNEGAWATANVTAIGYGGGVVVVSQLRIFLVGQTFHTEGRVMMSRNGAPWVELQRQSALSVSRLAVSPDGTVAVAQIYGDLYRWELP